MPCLLRHCTLFALPPTNNCGWGRVQKMLFLYHETKSVCTVVWLLCTFKEILVILAFQSLWNVSKKCFSICDKPMVSKPVDKQILFKTDNQGVQFKTKLLIDISSPNNNVISLCLPRLRHCDKLSIKCFNLSSTTTSWSSLLPLYIRGKWRKKT